VEVAIPSEPTEPLPAVAKFFPAPPAAPVLRTFDEIEIALVLSPKETTPPVPPHGVHPSTFVPKDPGFPPSEVIVTDCELAPVTFALKRLKPPFHQVDHRHCCPCFDPFLEQNPHQR
jgi:hypothetical protein